MRRAGRTIHSINDRLIAAVVIRRNANIVQRDADSRVIFAITGLGATWRSRYDHFVTDAEDSWERRVADAEDRFDALPAREKLLEVGLIDWFGLERVHAYVSSEHADQPTSVIQEKTLETVRSLVSEDLFKIGGAGEDSGFVAWDIPLDEAINRIREAYVDEYDDIHMWWFVCWLSLTEKGRRIAEDNEERYGLATPPLNAREVQAERERLLAASSLLVNIVAGYVEDLTPIGPGESPDWLTQLAVPAGWQRVSPKHDGSLESARVICCRPQPDGDWGATELINLFAFTGSPPADVVYDNADATLRELTAPQKLVLNIIGAPTAEVLPTPAQSGVIAVRSSGKFLFCNQWVWAQYTTHVLGSNLPGRSRLLQQCLYIGWHSLREELAADIAELNNSVHDAFIAASATTALQ